MITGNPVNALILYVGGILVAFVVRTVLHHAETGDTGFRPVRSPIGSLPWWSQLLLVVALLGGIIAPALELVGVIAPPVLLSSTAVSIAGIVLAAAGLAGLVAAQGSMGHSWRIGVDPEERTDMVDTGLFAVVRNPVFTFMIAAMAGISLLVPEWPQLIALGSLVAGVQIQVRAVEEPYLLRAHGDTYRQYAARTGRFLPLIGRIRFPPVELHDEDRKQ